MTGTLGLSELGDGRFWQRDNFSRLRLCREISGRGRQFFRAPAMDAGFAPPRS